MKCRSTGNCHVFLHVHADYLARHVAGNRYHPYFVLCIPCKFFVCLIINQPNDSSRWFSSGLPLSISAVFAQHIGVCCWTVLLVSSLLRMARLCRCGRFVSVHLSGLSLQVSWLLVHLKASVLSHTKTKQHYGSFTLFWIMSCSSFTSSHKSFS